jgi:hypothetical protein
MTISAALTMAVLVISAAVLSLTLAMAAGHAARIWHTHRMARLEKQYAPFVIRLANEEETDEEATRTLVALELAGLPENIGYRQLTAWWRIRGTWSALRRSEQVWGAMSRRGFKADQEAAKPAVTHPRPGVIAGRAHPRAGAPTKKPTKKKTRPAKETAAISSGSGADPRCRRPAAVRWPPCPRCRRRRRARRPPGAAPA